MRCCARETARAPSLTSGRHRRKGQSLTFEVELDFGNTEIIASHGRESHNRVSREHRALSWASERYCRGQVVRHRHDLDLAAHAAKTVADLLAAPPRLRACYPLSTRLSVVTDNHNTHKHARLRALMATHNTHKHARLRALMATHNIEPV